MSKAILVIDVEDIDIENTQATYIELQCNDQTRQISLINHWLKPMPEKKHNNGGYRVIDGTEWFYDSEHDDGWNACIDEILGEE